MPEFNDVQINALEKGEDISSVEYITVELPSVVPPSVHDIAGDDRGSGNTNNNPTTQSSSTNQLMSTSNTEGATAFSNAVSSPTASFPVHCFCWRDKSLYFL